MTKPSLNLSQLDMLPGSKHKLKKKKKYTHTQIRLLRKDEKFETK